MADRLLPPSVSAEAFDRALEAFAAAIGRDWVLTRPDQLQPYLDPYAFLDAATYGSAAALSPATVEEIQAIVRIANEFRIPLWTVSGGKNLGYGGAAPRVNGSVVLDLGRMKRIIEVDEEFGTALVEPGVTFFELYDHIRARNLKLMLSAPALGWGSVLGNALDRGFGYTPYGDHAAQVCGMEVVLADGSLVRTGMGALPGSNAWQLFKPGYGPQIDGLFFQSNFGIVTKLGLWLMPRPEFYMACEVRFQREADLAAIVDTVGPLRRADIIQNNAVLANATRLGAIFSPRKRWFDGEGAMPPELIDRIAKEVGLGWWNLRFSHYGPEAMVDERYRLTSEAFARIPGAEIIGRKYAMTDEIPGPDGLQAGIPSMVALEIVKYRGEDCGHLGFSPVVAPSGREAAKVYQMVKARAAEFGMDYFGGFTISQRHMNHIFLIIFDRENAKQRADVREMCRQLVIEGGAAGYGEYRSHIDFMDLVGEQYSYGDHAVRRFNQKLKDALDPNGVLSPGKQGIWPSGRHAP